MQEPDARLNVPPPLTGETPMRRLVRRDAVWIALLSAIWIGAFALQGAHWLP